jgi:hypothetical protein
MTGNIIGEEFREYVANQVNLRQLLYGSGQSINGNPIGFSRNPKVLNYLNNRNSWVKLASGVTVTDEGLDRIKQSVGQSGSIPEAELQNLKGISLAKNLVLFNTISSLNTTNGKFQDYTFRSGLKDKSTSGLPYQINAMYGGLGDPDQGLQPTPGINDVSIECVNRGSIRKAKITLKAYNKFQFTLIESLYLKVGNTMMLEWGWDKYIEGINTQAIKEGEKSPTESFNIEPVRNTIIEDKWFTTNFQDHSEILSSIEEYRAKYHGCYDGFFGKVSNFSWDFSSDGSYNISIDLITVGDIIESLSLNTPGEVLTNQAIEDLNDDANLQDESIFTLTNKSSKLEQYIFKQYSAPDNSQDSSSEIFDITIMDKNSRTNVGDRTRIPKDFIKFIRLGEFLSYLEAEIIPNNTIGNKKSPVLKIETTTNQNIVNVVPNQLSVDPKVCIVKPRFNSDVSLKSVERLQLLFSSLNDYTFEKNGAIGGKLMNVYLNLAFIQKCLDDNSNEKGDIFLFKFLESLCKGINTALGNINNIEPIIKEDRIITLIDQNPIPYIHDLVNLPNPSHPPVLEVFGYSNEKSNFVKNIKFQTKLDSKLATTVAVSATAGGNNTKNIDSTAFSKWGAGFEDRFQEKISDPISNVEFSSTNTNLTEYYNEALKYAKNNIYFDDGTFWDSWIIKSNRFIDSKRDYESEDSSEKAKLIFCEQFAEEAKQIKRNEDQETAETAALEREFNESWEIALLNMSSYNAQATQGKKKKVSSPNNRRYYDLFKDEELSKDYKQRFKTYISTKNNKNYIDTKESSTLMGFIPLNFDVTLDGIAGIKIYNKLNINQRFLPYQYPESLNFVITKVNHKISDNGWETSLRTLSTSNVSKNTKYSLLPPSKPVSANQNPNQQGVGEFTGDTPNANALRNTLNTLGYSEKGQEISNGGDITKESSLMASKVFTQLKSELPDLKIIVTGGNDRYHQNLNYNSRHKVGRGVDFVFYPRSEENIAKVEKVLQGFAAGNDPYFRYLNEYKDPTKAASGEHFHISWGDGTEGNDNLKNALALAQQGKIDKYLV